MKLIKVNQEKCQRDEFCVRVCPGSLFEVNSEGFPVLRRGGERGCILCGHCVAVCPHDAMEHGSIPYEKSPIIDPGLKVNGEAVSQLLKTRRSIRVYKNQPVPEEVIRKIMEVVRWAPTAMNRQPFNWVVVRDTAEVKKIGGHMVDYLRQADGHGARYRPFVDAWDKGKDMVLRGAPHLVFCHAPDDWPWNNGDAAIALSYFDIAASGFGLGACWAGILMMAYDKYPPLVQALNIPQGHKLFGAAMFGIPELRYRRIPLRRELRLEIR